MAKKINNDEENLMNLQKQLGKKRSVWHLIDQLAADGLALIDAENLATGSSPACPNAIITEAKVDDSKKLETALGEKSKNPYVVARSQILRKMNQWQQAEIARMEKDGDINNRHYDAFVRSVREKGDELSSKK